MNNVWIVVPIKDNSIDISDFINNLSGGFVIPENYEKQTFNNETMEMETELVAHPHFGKTVPNFSGRIVLVNTAEEYTEYDGVVHLEDFGDVNIARWMNTGIEHAVQNGASHVVVLSGPSSFDPSALFDALDEAETKEVVNMADGAAFVLSGSSDFRLDDQFKIWFWADDFYRRTLAVSGYARPDFMNFSELMPFVVDTPEHQAIVEEDQTKYNAKWS